MDDPFADIPIVGKGQAGSMPTVPSNDIPIGPNGELLDLPPNTGATNAYGGIPAKQTSEPSASVAEDPFADIPMLGKTNASSTSSPKIELEKDNPFADIPEVGKTPKELPWYKNLPLSAIAQTAAGAIQTAGGFERAGAAPVTDISGVNAPFQRGATIQEATTAFDKAIADKQAALDSIQGIVKKQGFSTAEYGNQINDLQREMGDLQAQKEQTLKLPQYASDTQQQELIQQRQQLGKEAGALSEQAVGMFPALGVSQQDTSIAAQLGRGIGGVIGLAPAMVAGPLALPAMAVMGGSQAYGEGYDAKVQELKQQGVTDQKQLDEAGHQAGSQAAINQVPALAAYTIGGSLTTAATSALLKGASPLVKGLVGGTAASGVNLGVSGGLRKVEGGNFLPNVEQAVPDILFGGLHGLGAGLEARAEAKKAADDQLGGPAPEVAPSSNPLVNEKEAQITDDADALHKTPPVTQEQKTSLQEELNKKTLETPEEKAKIRDQELSSKWDEMMSHPEGSPEREKAFQEYIDISSGKVKPTETSQAKPTAEAPATTDNTQRLIDLATQQLEHEEGSAEHTAIQQQIDELQKPAEAPAEAQPTTENAVQEPSAREVGVRNAPAVGEGVGEENKSEVPAQEGQAPKEEVAPKYTPEVQAKLDDLKKRTDEIKKMLKFYLDNKIIFNDEYQKRLKGLGMEAAAEKRRITGELTAKEQARKTKREEGNYKGKLVSVDGQNGVVVGNPFGRVKVRFEDGTESTHLPETIESPVETKPETPTIETTGEGQLFKNDQLPFNLAGEVLPEEPKPLTIGTEEEQQLPMGEATKPSEPEKPVNPYREVEKKYYTTIKSHSELADEVEKVANKEKNKFLKEAVQKYRDALFIGADMEPEVEKLLSDLEREGNYHDQGINPSDRGLPKGQYKKPQFFGGKHGDEIIRYLQENKILSKFFWKKEITDRGESLTGRGSYDGVPEIPKKHSDTLYGKNGKGQKIDDALKGLHEDGKALDLHTPDDLWKYIKEASDFALKEEEETKKQNDAEKRIREASERLKKLESDPEKLADAMNQDLKDYFDTRRGGYKGDAAFFEFPDSVKKAVTDFGNAVYKAGMSFGDWSKTMISRLGEGVRDYLRQIWKAAKDYNEKLGRSGGIGRTPREDEAALRRKAEEAKYGPKPLSEREAYTERLTNQLTKVLGRKPTDQEVSAQVEKKFGKAEAPAPVPVVGGEGEKISIRTKDQEDQQRRGILTSVVPAGEGTSIAGITEIGNANLRSGADPFKALQRARQGDFNGLATAKAYVQGLAKKVSEALKKYGANSTEYKDLAKQYQDYYEGLREAGTVASDILRTFQGETDLSDAADIAREYTKITGEEPSLSQHDQIRKIADKVNKFIEESNQAQQQHRDTMDAGLTDVEVKTPTSVDESRQQVADLSDASGRKQKAEIDRLNQENEKIKSDLEELKQAKGQTAEELKAYYEAKIKDLENQQAPKFEKVVLDQAQRIVDKWKADRLEAEKLLKKQLAQFGSFPDVSIVATLARIMRGHISELGLDFARSSKMILDQFGPKAEKFLKDAWDKAEKLVKGEPGGEEAVKVVKTARTPKPKAKTVEKIGEEKVADNLRKRIAQYEKKIDDINSGKISTPKDVEKITNEEIKGLEADLANKKQELSNARLKAKQADLFEKGKVGEKLNPEQVKTLWETAKRFYLDKGESDYDKMINDMASDLGLLPDQIRQAFSSPKGARKASDEMYLKQRNRQMALDEAKRWLDNQKASWIGKTFGALAEKTFKLAIFGHGTAFIGTHAPTTIYTHPRAAFKAWLKGFSYSFTGKNGQVKNIVENKDLIYRPNWITARKAGLENDPREIRREGATKERGDSVMARALNTISGGRGFDALFHLRQDMFDQAWDKLSVTQKTPEMADMLANSINNATGFTKGGKGTAGILQSPIIKILFFAPKLIASRFKWLVQDPARMLGTFTKMVNPFTKVTPEERMSAIYEAKNKAKFLAYLGGTLLANQALLSVTGSNQSINFTNPKKNDWLAYKGFGYQFSTVGAFTRIARLVAQEYHAIFGDLNRFEKAQGGREQAMKNALYGYFRSGFSPIIRDMVVGATGKDYVGNVVPWSKEQPDRGRRRLTWSEVIQEQFAPIPISEASTQKEIIPAVAKAASAAFSGGRLETPADIADYEKSLKPKQRSSSSGGF